MIDDLLTTLRNFGAAIYDFFIAPGDFMLSTFVEHAPLTAAEMGIDGGNHSVMLPAGLSLLFWFLLAVAAWKVLKLWRHLARVIGALIRTAWYRLSQAAGNLKTRLVCRLRQWLPHRQRSTIVATPQVDFDDLDLAVLRSAAARGPGFAVSAPELADKFTLRPSQVQRSLEKLKRNRMLDSVIGSTDGFDNYRLTDSGAAFVAMWLRQRSAT